MLRWDFVFSLGYLPLHHKQYKQQKNIYIFSYTFQYHSAPFLNLGFTRFVSFAVVEWLFYISWFTSVSIHLFTALVCTSYIYNCFSGFILKYIWIWAMSVHYHLCSRAPCLHSLFIYKFKHNGLKLTLQFQFILFPCTVFLPLSPALSFLQALIIKPILWL